MVEWLNGWMAAMDGPSDSTNTMTAASDSANGSTGAGGDGAGHERSDDVEYIFWIRDLGFRHDHVKSKRFGNERLISCTVVR